MMDIVETAWNDAQTVHSTPSERMNDVVVWLSSGEPHVCGSRCKDLILTPERLYVCKLSGVAWGPQQLRSDFSTGRCTQSANVDDNAGKVVGGFWKPRKNLIILSRQATLAVEHGLVTEEVGHPIRSALGCSTSEEDANDAAMGDDEEEEEEEDKQDQSQENLQRNIPVPDDTIACKSIKMNLGKPSKPAPPVHGKATGLVGAAPTKPVALPTTTTTTKSAAAPVKAVHKRNRDTTKVNTKSIQAECEATLIKLVTHESGVEATKTIPNANAVFKAAVLKYVRQQNQQQLNINVIHNLELQVRKAVAAAEAKTAASGRRSILTTPAIKETLFSLATAIWSACLKSPYFVKDGVARRANDSFRPIFAGLLYSFGRGVALKSGTTILPQMDCLERCIVSLKNASPTQRALHSLSHRGLCALHRIISSYGDGADLAFREAAFLSSELKAVVKRELGE